MKKRIFYLDFVRALSVVLIVITHYNALFLLWVPSIPKGGVFVTFLSNVYIGNIGVSLFFIISGAALMYIYGSSSISLKTFYKKRFMTLFPMFWLAYIVVLFLKLGENNGLWIRLAPWKWLLSVIGVDGLVSTSGISTYYLLGEWFLGFIIIVYLIFPFLKYLFERFPKSTIILVIILYIVTLIFYKGKFPISTIVTARLPEILFGMIFIKYIKKVNWIVLSTSIAVVIGNLFFGPYLGNSEVWGTVQTTYVGIAYFLILVYISKFFENKAFKGIVSFLSLYSYPIFLVHHVIIYNIMSGKNLPAFGIKKEYYYFIVILIIVLVFSYVLKKTNDWILNHIKSMRLLNVKK